MRGVIQTLRPGGKLALFLTILTAVTLVFMTITALAAPDAQAPTFVTMSPTNGSTVTCDNYNFSFTVNDSDDYIQNGNYSIKLNGQPLNASLQYQGHMVYPYWSDPYWQVDSYNKATISANATGLKDGDQTLEFQASDQSGNILTTTLTFTVACKPVFSGQTPANASPTKDSSGFSVKVTDNSSVSPQSIQAKLDGNTVSTTYDPSSGIISYKPASGLPDGAHTVIVNASDTAGNQASTTWSYTLQTAGPTLAYANDGKTFNASPDISVNVKSNVKLDSGKMVMQIDGKNVPATFAYKGHYDYRYGNTYYIVDSYNEGTIEFQTSGLGDGKHTIGVTAQDVVGNSSNGNWSFSVVEPPVFSGLQPANGSVLTTNPVIQASMVDPNGAGVDKGSIVLKVDGQQVTSDISGDQSKYTVSYTSDKLLNDAYHNVTLSAKDVNGNNAETSWKFFGSITGNPGFSNQKPDVTTGNAAPQISAHFSNQAGTYDINNISISIDGGAPVKPAVAGSNPEYFIYYTPATLKDGSHSVTLSIPNTADTNAPLTSTWSFTVNSPPQITDYSPSYPIVSSSPQLIAFAKDNDGLDHAVFTVDNVVYPAQFDSLFGRFTLKTSGLTAGVHDVTLAVYDTTGNIGQKNWQFTVDPNTGATFPEMPVNNNATCWSCHPNEANHNHIVPKECNTCHSPEFIKLQQFTDCIGCHYSTKYITATHSYNAYAWSNLPYRQHRITDLHISTTDGCQKCHSRVLTQEHYRSDRKDKNGNPITCDTCHSSAYLNTVSTTEQTMVKTAISNHDTSCTACHTDTNHDALHPDGLQEQCLTCHSNALSSEHLNNKTTAGKNFSCDTCHANTSENVKRAIATGNATCASCHTSAHGLPLSEKVPKDIPLYTGFTWTEPLDAGIFSSDPGAPSGYSTGKLLISNRQSVTPADVWNFYNTNLASQGWTLQSTAPSADATYFKAEFSKSTRSVLIRCFNTVLGDGTGNAASGYRLEIWYK